MFERLGRFVVGNPWKVIAGWVLITIAIVTFAPTLSDVTNTDQANFLPSDYESVQAMDLAKQAFGDNSGLNATIVVKRQDSQVLSGGDQSAIGDLGTKLDGADIDRVKGVLTGEQFLSQNKKVQLVNVALQGRGDEPELVDTIKDIRTQATNALRAPTSSTRSPARSPCRRTTPTRSTPRS
jgi:RND superfamily putative drug exporter